MKEGAKHKALGGFGVGGDGGRCYGACADGLRSVSEKAANPVDEEWWDVEVEKFLDHLMSLNSAEGRT